MSAENAPLNATPIKTAPVKKESAGFNNFFQTVRMIIQPMILATPAVLIWHFLYTNGWHSTRAADEPIINYTLPLLGSLHVFFAGFMFHRETGDIRELRHAVRNNDKDKFLELVEDRIPAPWKYILFMSATLIQGWTISLNYDLYWSGLATVLSIAYMLALIWEIICDFDDPVNGVWVIKGVPEEWVKEANIKLRLSDRFFEKLFNKIQKK